MTPVNREYKSTVFTMLFTDKEALLSLYNAVNGSDYRNVEELQLNTLTDEQANRSGIFSRMRNDVSFIFTGVLGLYEHQSTVNPNMPLRMLLYLTDILRGIVRRRDLYQASLRKIPTPQFLVFYNGNPEMADETELLLSEMYEVPQEVPSLELKVRVLNINSGRNGKLMKRCRPLWEYAEFVRRTRKGLGSEMTEAEKAAAMEEVVESCIRDGILEDFLKKNKESVIKNFIWEYDEEAEKEAIEAEVIG